MTVWSAERLAASAKKHMRLPRARSTPSSRHWMLQAEAGNAAAASLTAGDHSSPRSWASTATSCARLRHSSSAAGQRSFHFGRQKLKPTLVHALEIQEYPTEVAVPAQTLSSNPTKQDIRRDVEHTQGRQTRKDTAWVGEGGPDIKVAPTQVAEDIQVSKVIRDPIAGGRNSGTKLLSRKLSLQSEEALRQLDKLDVTLAGLEKHVSQLNQFARETKQLTSDQAGRMKTSLAQLEADANKLETKGVDCIYTSELRSGQVSAKEFKKAQLQRLEKLFVVIEDLFRFLNGASQNLQ